MFLCCHRYWLADALVVHLAIHGSQFFNVIRLPGWNVRRGPSFVNYMDTEPMNRKYLAFDIEIAKVLPDDADDLKAHRPLGISCAAVLAEDEDQPHLWYSNDTNGLPAPKMSRRDVGELVDFLMRQAASGYTILTWNGLSFDFDILAEESGRLADCQQLAIDHVDMMFHVFCLKGFAVALDAAAKAIGSQGKSPGVNAVMAPRLWAMGNTNTVLDYVVNDCKITLDVAKTSESRKRFAWVTRRGTESDFYLSGGRWKLSSEAIRLPQPDTSWMSEPPWPRSRFTSWLY